MIFYRFQLLERGPKLLYLNTTVRGYPHGLRAGSDPRAPIISVDGGFEKVCIFKYRLSFMLRFEKTENLYIYFHFYLLNLLFEYKLKPYGFPVFS